MTDILARLAICEKASIDECYLDITAEARRRLDASEQLQLPVNSQQVHVCGEVSFHEKLECYKCTSFKPCVALKQSHHRFTMSVGASHCQNLFKVAQHELF